MTYFKFSIVLFFLVSTSAFIKEYHLPNQESNYRSLSSVESEVVDIDPVDTKKIEEPEEIVQIKVDPLDTFVRVESNQQKALILSKLLLKDSLDELDKKRLLNLVINNFEYVDKFEVLKEEDKRIVEYYLNSFKSKNDIVNYLFNKIDLNKEDFLYFWKQSKNPKLFSSLNKKYLSFLSQEEYLLEDFYMIGEVEVYKLDDYVDFIKKNLDRALKNEDALIKVMNLENKERKETLLDYLFYTHMDNSKVQQLVFRYIDENKEKASKEKNRWFLWYLMGYKDITYPKYRNHLIEKILDKINPNFAWTTNTPLRLAILREDVALINLLLKKGASIHYRGKDYNSTPKTLLKENNTLSHKIHTYNRD